MFDKNLIFNFNSISYSKFLNSYQQVQMNSHSLTYPNLDFFRKPSTEAYNQIYLHKKKQTFIYQVIFFSLSLLFLFLGALIHFKTTNWKCDFYLGNAENVKAFSYLVCFSLSAAACFVGCKGHPEQEAIQAIVGRVKKTLTRLYKKEQRKKQLALAPKKELMIPLQELYYHAMDTVQERQEETLQLLERINYAKKLPWRVKDQLFNQAISELYDQLTLVVQAYQKGEQLQIA